MSRVVPILVVDQLDLAVTAYTSMLDVEVVMNHGWIATLASIGDPTVRFSLLTRDATAAVNPCMSIQVDDVDAVHQAAVESGFRIVHPLTDEAWGVRRFFFQDADGNVVNVLSHS